MEGKVKMNLDIIRKEIDSETWEDKLDLKRLEKKSKRNCSLFRYYF